MSTPVLTLDQRADLARAIWARACGETADRVGLRLYRTLDRGWIAIVDAPERDRAAPERDRAARGDSIDAAVDALLAALACDAEVTA